MNNIIDFIMNHFYGVLNLSVWGYVIVAFLGVQLTFMAVTLYLHREQAHRGIDLHPILQHLFRVVLWMTTGMNTKEWVAVHRKHHAKCDTPDDPHSPVTHGLKKVLLEGVELYKAAGKDSDMVEQYGRGTPEDWMERNVYSRANYTLGITLLVFLFLFLFGVPGIIMIAVQLGSVPFFAAGVINGVGHHTGYRNFECSDAATNIVPWGLIVAGEELHNNHHAFPSSAKFSVRPWEFDMGWMYITIFKFFGLVKVKRVAPKPVLRSKPASVDLETVRAVIVNRMHVLREYSRKVTLPEWRSAQESSDPALHRLMRKAKRALIREPKLLDESAKERLTKVFDGSQTLKTVHEFREQLRLIWEGTQISNEKLLAQLKEWCQQAEASGIRSLQEFSERLRSYTMQPASI